MAMRRVVQSAFGKTVRVFLRTNNSKLFSASDIFRKDGQSDGKSTPISAPSTEKGSNSSYSAAAVSKGYSSSNSGQIKISNLLTPTLKQEMEQHGSSVSALHSKEDSQSKVNPNSQSSQDARREILPSGGTSEKVTAHSSKTDQTSSNPQPTHAPHHDDVSLLASRRVDPTTVRQVYYFDTLALSKKLETKGFTREQAEGYAETLVEIISTTLDHQSRHMVTKPQQEIAVQQLMSEIVSVKKDMTLLQKSEFSSLKTDTEKISIELSQIQGRMGDEIVKLKGQFSLDINLERGRAIEAHAENEKKLQQLHNKIETEIANLRTIYEVYRNDVFKYAGGTVIAVGGLMLGVIRIWN